MSVCGTSFCTKKTTAMAAKPHTDEQAAIPLDHVRSGDVFFMNRKCWAMKDPLAAGLCWLTKTENRFDHVGMLLRVKESDLAKHPELQKRIVDCSPSGTYVLETNVKGVTLYAAEKRIAKSSANEIVSRSIHVAPAAAGTLESRFLEGAAQLAPLPYQSDASAILPSIFSPPDKMDRMTAAKKINALQHEIDAFTTMALAHPDRAETYHKVSAAYRRTQLVLLDCYFPHLPRFPLDDPKSVNWSRDHYWIDGVNGSPKMVCSELIANLWHMTGLTNGYMPASSMRPFDLLDEERFNFSDPETKFGAMTLLKASRRYAKRWKEAGGNTAGASSSSVKNALPSPMSEEARVGFFNRACAEVGSPAAVDSIDTLAARGTMPFPLRWVVQSAPYYDLRDEMWFRVLGSGILFSLCLLPCAPLTLRWMEGQVGLILVRGTVWTLGSSLFVRGLCFSVVQSAVAALFMHAIPAPPGSVMGALALSSRVDTRHAYYAAASTFALSAMVAHAVTTPVLNATLSRHFGPLRPGPLPRRLLLRGAFSLAPFSLLLPFHAYWLAWYETVGSFVVPTRSSVLRPRKDLLERKDWPHLRTDALIGAFTASLCVDALVYPVQSRVFRSLMQSLYGKAKPVSFGRRLYAGFHYRVASHVVVFGLAAVALNVLELL